MKVNIKKLHEDAVIPEYATDGSGCFDLHAIGITYEDRYWSSGDNEKTSITVRTGLAFEIPEDHVMLIYSRSGDGFNSGVRLVNCVGVIDSDYRGEVMVKLKSDPYSSFDKPRKHLNLYDGCRVAQGMIIPIPKIAFNVVEELSDTKRGTGGFGSTG